MSAGTASRGSRAFVAAGVCLLVAWQAAALVNAGRRTAVALGLYGFVFHVLFGKAYSLVPSYFGRTLAFARAPTVHLPLALAGTAALALDPLVALPLGTAGALAWTLGAGVFIATVLWTVRDNLSGAETATGDHNAHRRPVDRIANLFVPVALAYLAFGSWETLAARSALPAVFSPYAPRATHLLAAGVAALLLFAIGFRLFPRFLVVPVPRPLPWIVLPAGAVAPVALAAGLPAGGVFRAGAVLQAVAVGGFAVAYGYFFRATDRDRIGFYGPLAGVGFGLAGVGVGLSLAFGPVTDALVSLHYRANLLGFLGLSIVGVTYQFYPPAVGRFPGAGDRAAGAAMGLIALGLAVEIAAVTAGPDLSAVGRLLALAGAAVYAYLLLGVFVQRALD